MPSGEVAALGWSITANLGGDRQLVFQSHIALDSDDRQINALIDRTMRILDRQKATYEIADYQKELGDLNRDLSQGDENIAQAEEQFRKAQAQFDVQILELQAQIKTVRDGAATLAHQRGQSVKGALKGAPQTNIDRCEAGIEGIKAEKIKQEHEREAAIASFTATQERRRARVSVLEALIASKQALIDGG